MHNASAHAHMSISHFLGSQPLPLEQCSFALCSQRAWLQSGTVRDNVLFGRPLHERRYRAVLRACALMPDVLRWEQQDLTPVGERGTALSGGQRQRVALARAVYADADVYLFDDSLSAVDAHVAQWLVQHVLVRVWTRLDSRTNMRDVTHGMRRSERKLCPSHAAPAGPQRCAPSQDAGHRHAQHTSPGRCRRGHHVGGACVLCAAQCQT